MGNLFDTTSAAVSFKDMPAGSSHRLRVTKPAELAQSRDYGTGEPATYSNGDPKMSVVVGVENLATGAAESLWCPKPGGLIDAIGKAIAASGADDLRVDGTLEIVTTGLHDIGGGKSQRGYSATYTAPSAFAAAAAPAAQPTAQPAPAGAPNLTIAKALIAAGLDDATVMAQANLSAEQLAALKNVAA